MYMSYCRFEGTNAELRTCLNVVQEHINGEAEYEVSEREIREFRLLMSNIEDFMTENGLWLEDGMDYDKLDEICEKMRHPFDDDEQEAEYDEW